MKITIYILILIFCNLFIVPIEQALSVDLTFPERTISDWNVENAVSEAEHDIKNETIKIYFSGTIASFPSGVKNEDMPLIKNYPTADAGIGCIIENSELRKAQHTYAETYNKTIVNYLKSK